jgi:hypothetical protein
LASLILNDIKGFKESGIKKGDRNVAFGFLAPLIDERCSYLSMLDFKILWKLDYKDSPKLEKH